MPHIHEKIDYAADVLLVNGDAVLLRKHEKYDMWLAAGGHVELDEDMFEAARRECLEETGIEPEFIGEASHAAESSEHEIMLPRYINRHPVNDTHEHISFVYFARAATREVKPAPGEKTDGFKWFTESELDDESYGIRPRMKAYAKAALKAAREES